MPSFAENSDLKTKTDIVVVGAGPSGSFSALKAAQKGADVTVFEEHEEIGLPSHCAGHVSKTGLESLGLYLPPNAIENQIRSAVFYSPSGYELTIRLPDPVTIVINRALFDKHLAQLAESAGARFMLGQKVESVLFHDEATQSVLLRSGEELSSKIVIDAEGGASALLKQVGLQGFDKSKAVVGVNAEADHVDDVERDRVEVYLTQKDAPGLFAWIIPRQDGSAKVGLATNTGNPLSHLKNFWTSHPIARKKLASCTITKTSFHMIPLGGPIPKTYANRFLAVGDVASQVKPTTGGGVIMGLTCARIGGEIATTAMQHNDFSERFLSQYQSRCQKVIGFDMAIMRQIRLMINRLSDKKLDDIIKLSARLNLTEDLRKINDIDFQGRSLIPLFISPAPLIVMLDLLLASLT
jgi:digeranylgeranylglycerophospholipid reductase